MSDSESESETPGGGETLVQSSDTEETTDTPSSTTTRGAAPNTTLNLNESDAEGSDTSIPSKKRKTSEPNDANISPKKIIQS